MILQEECTSEKVIAQVQKGDKYQEKEDNNEGKEDFDEKKDRKGSWNTSDESGPLMANIDMDSRMSALISCFFINHLC